MEEMNDDQHEIDPVKKLNRDLKKAALTLTATEARFLVDSYYTMQRDRIRADHQQRQLAKNDEPHAILEWLSENTSTLERNVKSALAVYSKHHPVGRWAQSITGIGPVISAGLLAHIDMEPFRCVRVRKDSGFYDAKAKPCNHKEPHGPECHRSPLATCGQVWRFAGLDPTVQWKEGQKRPWNGNLKRLCWIIGEMFTRQQAKESDVYGKLYAARKVQEEAKNANHDFEDQAKTALATKNWKRDTQTKAAYEQGLLPQGRIHLRAQRWAVKLFLSHYHEAAFFHHFGTLPPKPYVIEHLGHAHYIQPPNMHLIAGWAEARAKAGI